MIPAPNVDLVLIILDKVEETMKLGEKELEKSEVQKMNERKAQSRGIVFDVGDNVKWPEKGDYVSFTRSSASEIKEDDKVYFAVHYGNILCKFKQDAKK